MRQGDTMNLELVFSESIASTEVRFRIYDGSGAIVHEVEKANFAHVTGNTYTVSVSNSVTARWQPGTFAIDAVAYTSTRTWVSCADAPIAFIVEPAEIGRTL